VGIDRPVRMCVCHAVTFEELRQAELVTLEEIADRYGCGTGCGACLPYLQRMLATGETAFAVISAEDGPLDIAEPPR
jgi:bacterioferritin-associated ferredoxin